MNVEDLIDPSEACGNCGVELDGHQGPQSDCPRWSPVASHGTRTNPMSDHQERLFEVYDGDAPDGCDCEVCDGCGEPTDQPVDIDGELLCEACAHPVLLLDPRPVVTIDTGGLL